MPYQLLKPSPFDDLDSTMLQAPFMGASPITTKMTRISSISTPLALALAHRVVMDRPAPYHGFFPANLHWTFS